MFEKIKLNTLDEYFVPYSGRSKKGVFFCRLALYSEEIHKTICQFIETTKSSGVCLSESIGNPDEKQLSYYDEIMGRDFQLNPNFFVIALKKWLPRIKAQQRTDIANAFYDIFIEMAKSGKNEHMQINAYIKFMCWLYYKFEPILHKLGDSDLPKILFEGYLSDYELKMMTILSKTGSDILILQYHGDEKYLQVDPKSNYSQLVQISGTAFPVGYSIIDLRKQLFNQVPEPELKQFKSERVINTNTWLLGDPFADALKTQSQRGEDKQFYYNLFVGVYGAEDPGSYDSELLKWKMKMESFNKQLLLVEHILPLPEYEEVNSIKRKEYQSTTALLNEMVFQIRCSDRVMLTYCQAAFMGIMKDQRSLSITKLLNLSVVIICWLNRYLQMFSEQQSQERVFLFFGELKKDNERLFIQLLARLPIDVMVINPELVVDQEIMDKMIFIKKYDYSLKREKFPVDLNQISFETVAFQAEQDLNTLMYQDTGVFRNQQFKAAIPIPLQTTNEEIDILWGQEARFRPNFETFDDRVMVPVIGAKISGVKGSMNDYWNRICDLMLDDVFFIQEFPYQNKIPNPFKDKAYSFLNGGRLDLRKIKTSPTYPFSFIREPMQDFMLQKLQEIIDQKIIIGTGSNGVENLIVATIFNLDRKLLRLIQKFDFTKDIPKVLVIHTKESNCSQEDSILFAYLNMIGFDIAMFVPTGYASVERFYTKQLFVEHQIGEYKYDVVIPDLEVYKKRRDGIAGRLFRRGW